ncbi:MAG: nuclear transport factor 2 family protein [Lautropia sp.]
MPRSLTFASAAAVQDAFYAALAHADIAGVMSLWADDEEVVCVHPGGQRLVGLHAVRQSFEEILAHGPVQIRVRDLHVFEGATLSVHNLVEQITVAGSRGAQLVSVLTTNVYIKGAAGWQLLVHHATPGQEIEQPARETPAGKLH